MVGDISCPRVLPAIIKEAANRHAWHAPLGNTGNTRLPWPRLALVARKAPTRAALLLPTVQVVSRALIQQLQPQRVQNARSVISKLPIRLRHAQHVLRVHIARQLASQQ